MTGSRSRRLGRLLTLACLGLTALVLTALPAWGHAVLQEATPADRSVLDSAPEQVTLRFNEPVSLPTGGLRVFDADARRVDEGTLEPADERTVAVALPDALADGGYVVTWRVLSADSHPVTGVFTFTVGDAREVDDAVVAELFAGDDAVTSTLGPALRAATYAGVLLAVGGLYLAVVVARRPEDRRRARTLAHYGAIGGVAATLLALPVQAMAVTGEGPLAIARPGVLGELLVSSFGQGTLVRFVWLSVLLIFLARRAPLPANVLAGTAALLSFLLDGHQRSAEPTWLLMLADAVHLGAAALWFGGLVLLAWLVRARRIDDDPVGAARVVSRFSSAALLSVLAVTAAGGVMAWALVRTPRALMDTTYGGLLLVKVGLVVLVVLAAAHNRFRLVPAVATRVSADPDEDVREEHGEVVPSRDRSRAAWGQLRTTLVVEVALLVVVLGVTGVLVATQPAAEEAGVTGAAQVVVPLTDDLDVEVIVDPNEVGINALHVYVLDATGRPAADVGDLALELTYVPEDIGPFAIEPFSVGAGHWTANVDTLRFPGEWDIEMVAGIDRFTEARASTTVVVNR